nr:phage virion morphogenesis protein [Escherichia coli]
MAELQKVDDWLSALLANLEPAARSRMMRQLAQELRRTQQQNIRMQRNPDGSSYEPRRVTARSKKGRIKRQMFTKLRTTKYLKTAASADSASVQFEGKVQRIARVHHYGLRDRISRRGPEVRYANRSNAERAAKMQWERLQRGVASFSLQLAEGRADLYTEMPVKVSGFKQPIDDAEWTITTLTHTVSPDNGFTTSLELEVRIDDFEME